MEMSRLLIFPTALESSAESSVHQPFQSKLHGQTTKKSGFVSLEPQGEHSRHGYPASHPGTGRYSQLALPSSSLGQS